MSVFLVIFWLIFIFMATCTDDVHAILHEQSVSFTFQPKPAWQEFNFFYPVEQISDFEMIGHFLLFFVLTILLSETNARTRTIIIFSVLYAMLTEVLQLFFNRGAELYDIMADILGIMVAVCIVGFYRVISRQWRGYVANKNSSS